METILVSDRLSNALSFPLVWQFFIEIGTTSVSRPPRRLGYDQLVTSAPPSQICPNTRPLDENDCSQWRAFQCVIACFVTTVFHWDLTTSVSDSPAHISQTQIWPDSDVIKSYLPDAPRLPKTWWKRPQLVMVFPTNYRLRYYELFSFKCMRRCENDRLS